jgi:calcium-independent phospholipase A2
VDSKNKVLLKGDVIWVFLVRNNSGASPRHCIQPESGGDKILYILHSVGAPRCLPDMQGCTRGCESASDDHNGVPPPLPPSSDSREILNQMLSVAGMGIAATR